MLTYFETFSLLVLDIQWTILYSQKTLFPNMGSKQRHIKNVSSDFVHTALFYFFQVQADSVLLKFQTLHHFFFVLCKLLKEGVASSQILPGNSSDDAYPSKFSSQGGFLRQPVFDSLPNNISDPLNVDCTSWEKFSCLLAEIAWPSVLKCLVEGKAFIDYKISQVQFQIFVFL